MAHFAQLNENNLVIAVEAVANEAINNLDFPDSEPVGIAFLQNLFGENTAWKQTSYNNNFRVRYAGIGYTYSSDHDAFIAPQPFPSWVLDQQTLSWVAPVPYPQDGKQYVWDENTKTWVEAKG